MSVPYSRKPELDQSAPEPPVWGWKMLFVVASASTANILIEWQTGAASSMSLAFMLLSVVGLGEYAFARHWIPLSLWRVLVPIYTFDIVRQIGILIGRAGKSSEGHQFSILIVACGLIFFGATIIALGRRARYLGPSRIPFGALRTT